MTATIVILAAGIGSRFGGPKQLVPVGPGGESILDYNIHDAVSAGFGRVVVVTRVELESEVEVVVNRSAGGARAAVRLQRVPAGRSKPYGTADAVLAAARDVSGAFGVANADDLYGTGSFEALRRHLDDEPSSGAIVGFRLADTVPAEGSVSRALLAHDGNRISRVVEVHGIHRQAGGWQPAEVDGFGRLSDDALVSMNLLGLPAWVMDEIRGAVDAFIAAGADGEIYLPELVGGLVATGRLPVALLRSDEAWAGMTNPEDLELVRNHVRDRRLGGGG